MKMANPTQHVPARRDHAAVRQSVISIDAHRMVSALKSKISQACKHTINSSKQFLFYLRELWKILSHGYLRAVLRNIFPE